VTVWDVDQGRPLFGPLRSRDTGPQRFGEFDLQQQITQADLRTGACYLLVAVNTHAAQSLLSS